MNRAVSQLLVNLVVTAVMLGLYHRLWVLPALQVGIIDLAEVYRQQEAEFTRQVTNARSETERELALERVKVFAQRLPQALEELPRECNCLVVIKGAISPPADRAVDLTAALKRKVGQP